MSSQLLRFKVGEEVKYPQIVFAKDKGRHEVVKTLWKVKAIFPISEMAILAQAHCRKGANVQVPLSQLINYN